jgi:sugar lactone lactonase YvrE
MTTSVTRVPVPAGSLAEGPLWDARAGGLYWVDIPAGRVHFLDEADGHRRWDVGQPVGAVVARQSGGLVLAARDGFFAFDPVTGQTSCLAAVEAGNPENRMNDGACDRAGRFWAGTMAQDEHDGAGALYRLDPSHKVVQIIEGITVSNGIGWSLDERLMYYADSPTRRVDVFDYDPAAGTASNRRQFAVIEVDGAVPDGLIVDAEGGVWVALWGGSALHRYTPDGRLDQVIGFPSLNVTKCAFGGAGLDVLYVTAAAGPGEAEGALYRCAPGVTGLPANPYRG